MSKWWSFSIFVIAIPIMAWSAPSQESTTDCATLFGEYLRFDPTLSARISPQTSIGIALSEDAYFLEYQLEAIHGLVALEDWSTCTAQAQQIDKDLFSFFKKRFDYLLTQNQVDTFYTEYENLLAPRTTTAEIKEIQDFIEPFEGRYLEAIYKNLMDELAQNPRWSEYPTIPVSLETWSGEWAHFLNREAPAAVDLDAGKIAIRPLDDVPAVPKIFIFHEIAHLVGKKADPRCADAYEDEVYAWQETVAYLQTWDPQKIPPLFQQILSNIHLIGLARWVKLVVMTRLAQ